MTTPPSAISTTAVTRSPARILLLGEAALLHQLLVQLLVLRHPLRVLVAGRERRLERALAEVRLELRRVADLLQEADVPVDRRLRHVGRAEDAAQHVVGDVGADRLLD